MTFRERQNRLTRLFCVLVVLAFVPYFKTVLDGGDFTPAGMALYCLTLLVFGIPAVRLGVQHFRALHPGQGRRS